MHQSMLKYLVSCLLFIALFTFCTEEELDRGRQAEAHYVDLIYALAQEDEDAAREAASLLNRSVANLRVRWYRPMEDEKADDMFFHFSKAQTAYREAQRSIKGGDLELASVQLDRAVYELSAADPLAFNELYVSSIYDFIATWTEVNRAVQDQELCNLEWLEFSRYGKDARYAWQQVKWRSPSSHIYPFTELEEADFRLAHNLLDLSIDEFIKAVKTGDQCEAQLAATEVDKALWELLFKVSSYQPGDL